MTTQAEQRQRDALIAFYKDKYAKARAKGETITEETFGLWAKERERVLPWIEEEKK